MFRTWTSTAAALAMLAGCAQITVEKLERGKPAKADGVIYALPNTVVRVQAKVDKAERTGARYAPFAQIFAPEGKPICKAFPCGNDEKIKFSIQEGATFTTYGEPDPDNVFLVRFTGGGLIDQDLSMGWNEAGLLSTASATVNNRTVDVLVSTAKLLAGVGTKLAAGAARVGPGATSCPTDPIASDNKVIPVLRNSGGAAGQLLIDNYCALDKAAREALSTDYDLLADAARFYAAEVVPLETARRSILQGAVPVLDVAGAVTRLDAEIDKVLAKGFIGKKETTTWDATLDVRGINSKGGTVILRIDPRNGVCITGAEIAPASKAPPAGFLANASQCSSASEVSVAVDYYPSSDKQLFSRITDDFQGERSFRYRIPAQVLAELKDSSKSYGIGTFSIAQMGTIVSLPSSQGSKTLKYDLAFIEATGGLKTFKLGTTGGLDSATIDALAGVGGTLADFRNSSRKNEDELTSLTRQDQLLKLKDDICTIQKKYGLQCSVSPD